MKLQLQQQPLENQSRMKKEEEVQKISSLLSLCKIQVARSIAEKNEVIIEQMGEEGGENILPPDLADGVLQSASAQDLLDGFLLRKMVTSGLRRLDLYQSSNGRFLAEEEITNALKVCNQLETLNLHGRELSRNIISHLPTTLRSLDISLCQYDEDLTKLVLSRCPLLEDLNLSGNNISENVFNIKREPTSVLDDLFQTDFDLLLPGHCHQKRKRRNSKNSTPQHICSKQKIAHAHPCPSPLEIQPKKKRTTRSNLCHKVIPKKENMVSNPIHSGGYVLRRLSVAGCSITNRTLIDISINFPYLESFDCSHVIPQLDIKILLNNCLFLKELHMNGCVIDQSQSFLIPLRPIRLQGIYFSGTGELTTHFLELLEHTGPYLQHLHLRNKSLPQPLNYGTQFLRSCPALLTLDLYGVPLAYQLIPDLLAQPRNRLQTLDISQCSGISVEHFLQLARHTLTDLRHLTLTIFHSSIVTALYDLGQYCPNLKRLCVNLDYRRLLDEAEVLQLVSRLGHLKELEVWCCKSISLETISKIIQQCPVLKKLLISTADIENDTSPLTSEEFNILTETNPQIQFKIWHHSIYGNRYFRYHRGALPKSHNLIPKQTSTLSLKTTQIEENGKRQIIPTVLVDNIPIWSNETSASLCHLHQTITGDNGALPMISEWCCECNIHNYNGVLFYHDGDQVIWETHEPGIKKIFPFSKNQYMRAINEALDHHMIDI